MIVEKLADLGIATALTAHAGGLAVVPLTAAVENPVTRRAAALVSVGQYVWMLFRLGRPPGPLPPPGATRSGRGQLISTGRACRRALSQAGASLVFSAPGGFRALAAE